jgi:flagellar hook assembly protein FlgD
VATILEGELSVGTYRVTWDGKNSEGQDVSSGVYLYRLVAGETVVSRKMLLLK